MAADAIQLRGTPPAGVVFVYYDGLTGDPRHTGDAAYETWQDGHYASYRVVAAQQGTSNRWVATRPAGVEAPFAFVARLAAGGVLSAETPLGSASTEPVTRFVTVQEHATTSGG